MTVTFVRRLALPAALAAVLALAVVPGARAAEEVSLLAPNGTLYTVSAGTGAELGVAGNYAKPDDNLIEWSYLNQDGSNGVNIIPGTVGSSVKDNLTLAYDDPSGAFLVLWKEDVSLLNVLKLGVLKSNQWTVSNLLPNPGFPHAYNPQMLLSHLVVHTLDGNGNDVATTRSILSVIWWEDSNVSQARYAPIFLDDDSSDIQVYDLPTTIGIGGTTSESGIPAGAYLYPALQLDGPSGGILASFSDLANFQHHIVQITFPTNLGTPGPTNLTWLRRHAPIVGGVDVGPIARMAPGDGTIGISTFIGGGYRPTLLWRDAAAVHFTRFDGSQWSDVNSITLDNTMTYDRALRLVQDMATKN